MPYTPPSQHSPAVSKTPTPTLSRSQSYLNGVLNQEPSSPGPRPGLPRSTSSSMYLSKHRRGPSIPNNESSVTSKIVDHAYHYGGDADELVNGRSKVDVHGSLSQSPPPVNNALIPTGAMISPPDSSHNSSDDEENHRGRTRELANLAELQAAIRNIEQRKQSSPNRNDGDDEAAKARAGLGLQIPTGRSELNKSFSADDIPSQAQRLPLSKEARKISHSRSSTESHILRDAAEVQSPIPISSDSDADEDDDDDAEIRIKPPMVRKKSGELVRPALRPSSAKRRPSSMPGTPTYSKAVHFDSHLEHVRHFLQVDKPLAVSAGSSPVENYESEIEFPFSQDDGGRGRGPLYEWEIKLSNFPADTEGRKPMPVLVDRVFLSSDNKNLIGTVAVQNLSFHKSVTARFTLDYWKTTSEVAAEYNNDVRRQNHDGCDRFNFTIRLTDLANLENKTLFFCVRYNVNGQEFWDSNGSINYQIDFVKKAKAPSATNIPSGLEARPLNALPRSRPSPPTSNGRPKTAPADSLDDFSNGFETYSTFGHSPDAVIGDPQLKLRNPRSRIQVVPDAPARRSKPASAQAFGNRYDFGASLNAAIQNASVILGDQSGLTDVKPVVKKSVLHSVVVTPPTDASESKTPTPEEVTVAVANRSVASKPAALISEKPSHQSQSYQELVDKYCFFGSSKSSPQLTKSMLGLVDGASDDASVSDGSVGSGISDNSPPRTALQTPSLRRNLMARNLSPKVSRSSSPIPNTGLISRTASPVSFGYPYHSSKSNSFFPESHLEYAIKG